MNKALQILDDLCAPCVVLNLGFLNFGFSYTSKAIPNSDPRKCVN